MDDPGSAASDDAHRRGADEDASARAADEDASARAGGEDASRRAADEEARQQADDDARREADEARQAETEAVDDDLNEGMAATRGRRYVAPMAPPEALNAYVAPRSPRRRRKDWPALLLAMVISAVVFVGCCIAGFALYSTRGK